MMIVDMQQVMISNLLAGLGGHTNTKLEPELLRHMCLNSLRRYNVKFGNEYGELVIATDSRKNWRHDVFPYYKANRKKARTESELDWEMIFETFNMVTSELKEFFPFRVLNHPNAEADDIIGSLCNKFGTTEFEFGYGGTKILIISGDKDFRQLQKYENVKQYDPVRDRWLNEKDPALYLKEHIIRGDKGDGIVNILSPENSMVLDVRQKSIYAKKLNIWLTQEPEEFCDSPEMLRRYKMNEALIDLSLIPDNIQEEIIEEFESQDGKTAKNLLAYFMKHRLKTLTESIGEFKNHKG